MKKLFSFLLSICLTFAGLPAFAQPAKIEGRAYLLNCEGLLQALREESVDAYLMDQVSDEAQAMQLLFDHGMIFGANYTGALRLALAEMLTNTANDDSVKEGVTYQQGLARIFADPEQVKLVAEKVFARFPEIAAALPDPNESRVVALRAANFARARTTSGGGIYIEQAMIHAVTATIAMTLKHNAYEAALLKGSRLESFLTKGLSSTGIPAGLYLAYALDSHGIIAYGFGGAVGWYFGLLGGTLLALQVQKRVPSYSTENLNFEGPREAQFANAATTTQIYGLSAEAGEQKSMGVYGLVEACELDVCALSPVAIASLGHVDILQVQDLAKKTGASLSGSVIESALSAAQKSARDLMGEPASVRKQLIFTAAMNDVDEVLIQTPKSVAHTLIEKIDGLDQAIRKLKALPFREGRARMTDDRLLKSEMLILKLQSDLQGLQALKFDQQNFDARLVGYESIIEKIKTRLAIPPETDGGWKSVAEESLLDLEQLKLGAP